MDLAGAGGGGGGGDLSVVFSAARVCLPLLLLALGWALRCLLFLAAAQQLWCGARSAVHRTTPQRTAAQRIAAQRVRCCAFAA